MTEAEHIVKTITVGLLRGRREDGLEPIDPWEGTRDALDFAPFCPRPAPWKAIYPNLLG